jgi:hypothetical protein
MPILRPSELPAKLLSAPLVWVRRGGLVPPLQPLYDGTYMVLRPGPCSFTIRVRSRVEVVAVSHLKACTAADASSGSLVAATDHQARAQAVLLQPSGSVFKPVGFFAFSFIGTATRRSRNRFPTRQGGFSHARDKQHLHSLHRRGTHPFSGHRPRGWTSDLFSSQPRPELGGSPVESCLLPLRQSNQSSVLESICTVLVYKPPVVR